MSKHDAMTMSEADVIRYLRDQHPLFTNEADAEAERKALATLKSDVPLEARIVRVARVEYVANACAFARREREYCGGASGGMRSHVVRYLSLDEYRERMRGVLACEACGDSVVDVFETEYDTRIERDSIRIECLVETDAPRASKHVGCEFFHALVGESSTDVLNMNVPRVLATLDADNAIALCARCDQGVREDEEDHDAFAWRRAYATDAHACAHETRERYYVSRDGEDAIACSLMESARLVVDACERQDVASGGARVRPMFVIAVPERWIESLYARLASITCDDVHDADEAYRIACGGKR